MPASTIPTELIAQRYLEDPGTDEFHDIANVARNPALCRRIEAALRADMRKNAETLRALSILKARNKLN